MLGVDSTWNMNNSWSERTYLSGRFGLPIPLGPGQGLLRDWLQDHFVHGMDKDGYRYRNFHQVHRIAPLCMYDEGYSLVDIGNESAYWEQFIPDNDVWHEP